MSHGSLSRLTSGAARHRLETVDLEEKSCLAEGLALIALIDRRRDFLEAGYASMHAYGTGKLGWSDDRTLRRIQAARLAQRVPLLLERSKPAPKPERPAESVDSHAPAHVDRQVPRSARSKSARSVNRHALAHALRPIRQASKPAAVPNARSGAQVVARRTCS